MTTKEILLPRKRPIRTAKVKDSKLPEVRMAAVAVARVKQAAKEQGLTVSAFIRGIIQKELRRLELRKRIRGE